MADVEEIRAYVESHPEDHKQRWRLAKKLYNDWDFLSALEHLQLLREVWPEQVPVLRYLAATYYRLGKYDEAAEILVGALKDHPDDASLMEQLAKIHEGAGRTEQAIEVWSRVLEIAPDSPKAQDALERLGMAVGTIASTMAGTVAARDHADRGDDTLVICPNCGEGNDIFSRRCVRCHADFGAGKAEDLPVETAPHFGGAAVWIFVISFIVIIAAALGVFYWIAY